MSLQTTSHAYKIEAIPAFTDNYIWCLHNGISAVVVDPGDAAPVVEFLQQHGLNLTDILVTHHHYDHTGGILSLMQAYPKVNVIGPHNPRIQGITQAAAEGEMVSLESLQLSYQVIEIPGHTLDHIAFFNQQEIFCGDTLFSAGCGRMFEGTAPMFLTSLQKIRALPSATQVYCAHEYTLANLKFAYSVDKQNKTLAEYTQWASKRRQEGLITLPCDIDMQIKINPFLRTDSPVIRATINQQGNYHCDDDVSTFAALRSMKDNF